MRSEGDVTKNSLPCRCIDNARNTFYDNIVIIGQKHAPRCLVNIGKLFVHRLQGAWWLCSKLTNLYLMMMPLILTEAIPTGVRQPRLEIHQRLHTPNMGESSLLVSRHSSNGTALTAATSEIRQALAVDHATTGSGHGASGSSPCEGYGTPIVCTIASRASPVILCIASGPVSQIA